MTLSRVVVALGLPLAAGLTACSAQSSAAPMPLGRIEIVTDQACGDARCVDFVVTDEALDEPASGQLMIDEPVGDVVGTIVLFSGGGGNYFWGTPLPAIPDGPDLSDASRQQGAIAAWLDAGFRIARIRWDKGWFDGSDVDEGFARLAARPATVTDWIADHVATESAPLGVGGVSGGAGQTAYMLTHYGLADRIDLAVPFSGFWMGRIDTGCLNENPLDSLLSSTTRRAKPSIYPTASRPANRAPARRETRHSRSSSSTTASRTAATIFIHTHSCTTSSAAPTRSVRSIRA
jgi:hypothetical protein